MNAERPRSGLPQRQQLLGLTALRPRARHRMQTLQRLLAEETSSSSSSSNRPLLRPEVQKMYDQKRGFLFEGELY